MKPSSSSIKKSSTITTSQPKKSLNSKQKIQQTTVSTKKVQDKKVQVIKVQKAVVIKGVSKQKPATQKPSASINSKYKKQVPKVNGWGYISYNLFLTICQYYGSNAYEIYHLSTICHIWRYHIMSEDGKYCWKHLNGLQKPQSFKQLKQHLQQKLIVQRQKTSIQYQKCFTKLFNYGSTKQNIPNKLIQKLNLQISLKINNKLNLNNIKYKLKTFNFSSYLYFKEESVKDLKYDFYSPHNMFKDKLNIKVKFFSRKFKVTHQIDYTFLPENIVQLAIRQKAFNYYLQKNIILTFFQGDDHFLYFFFEISALQLVNIFRAKIAQEQKLVIKKAMKKVPLHKKLAQTKFDSFQEYIKYQADFQVHMSYHNSIKQIFTFCDTKAYPSLYDNKKACFFLKVNDTFPKVDTYKLDNKMGISQSVTNLYLLDLTLKDRDKFLITFSGFIYARKAQVKEREQIQDYFNYHQNQIKVLEFNNNSYQFKILIIQELKKNLIPSIQLHFYA